MVRLLDQPGLGLAVVETGPCSQYVTADPVHHEPLLTQVFSRPKKLSHRDSSTDLVHDVACLQIHKHGRQVARPTVRVVSEAPTVSAHTLRKQSAEERRAMH